MRLDRLLNARLTDRVIPRVLLKGLLGYAVGGLLLALAVPRLHARGISLRWWMAWGTIVLSIGTCIAPELYRRYRRRAMQG